MHIEPALHSYFKQDPSFTQTHSSQGIAGTLEKRPGVSDLGFMNKPHERLKNNPLRRRTPGIRKSNAQKGVSW
jgi:hypothetical protein